MRDRPDPATALHWPREGGHGLGGRRAAQAQRGARRLRQPEKREAGTAPPWRTAMAWCPWTTRCTARCKACSSASTPRCVPRSRGRARCQPTAGALDGPSPRPRAELRLLLKEAGIAVLLAAQLGYVSMTEERVSAPVFRVKEYIE